MRRPRLALPLLNPRRRLRDRLIVAMVVVALLPLGIFTLLTAVNLGAMSKTTLNATHSAILGHQEVRLQSQVGDAATHIADRLGALASGVRDLMPNVKKVASPAGVPLQAYQGVDYYSNQDTSLVLGKAPPGSLDTSRNRATRLADGDGSLVTAMRSLLTRFPVIEAVWATDAASSALRTVPALDVRGSIDAKRISSSAPGGEGESTALALSLERIQPADGTTAARPPNGPIDAGPFWTDPYSSRQTGAIDVTVWWRVDDAVTLGADIPLAGLTDILVAGQLRDQPNAYPLVVSSSNTVIATPLNNNDAAITAAARNDFGAPPVTYGALPLPRDNPAVGDKILTAERSGKPQMVTAGPRPTDDYLFVAGIEGPQWVLISAVPRTDLEPDVTGLTRGIDSGIRQIFVDAIPVAVILILLAIAVATLFARRMVGPVRALTTSAERLAEGHTDEAVPPQGHDEVGDLAASLERMRREINNSQDAILAASRELEQRVASRTGELRARNEELVALNELAGSLTRSLEPESILDGALEAVRAILPVRAGRGFILDANNHLAAVTPPANQAGGADRALQEVAAAALEDRHLVTRRDGEGVLIGLPMATRGGQLGAIGLRSPVAPGAETADLLMAIANQVGLALRTSRLSAEGRELAVLEERTRLAREIHDTLAQELTGIVIQLEAAQALIGRDSDRALRTMVVARDLARSALQEARRSVWDLRPAPLNATGVVAAVQMEVERFRERTGISARMRAERMTPPPALQPQGEVALLRITQQALTNIADHSRATRVTVRLRRVGDEVELCVRDNGRGFDPQVQRPGSFGMVGMAERARLAGGFVDVDSALDGGTSITVRLPIAVETVQVPA